MIRKDPVPETDLKIIIIIFQVMLVTKRKQQTISAKYVLSG